ncbi:MAG: hypothetical protein QMD36_00570 [Candidatus Aenigmarchaeota archaeon]|nr:hypothetical protein [Candidatus Aenigmarchaeota archaeon]
MDGTWYPAKKTINYIVCPSCKQLVKGEDIIKGKNEICRRCAEI